MAISNELSSEIAAAILANNNSPQDLLKLKAVVLEIHSTLQKMSEDEHKSRLRAATIGTAPTPPDNRSH
jgi:predicted transcriptional regulator